MVARPGMTGARITHNLINNHQAHEKQRCVETMAWNDFPERNLFTMTTTPSGRIRCL
jgi:hypothetical protein